MNMDVKASRLKVFNSLNNGSCLIDVNECGDDDLHFCEQVCNNTHGSHNCLCFDGYELSIDGFSCNGEKLVMLR
jgi:hypothetical protein